MEEDKQIDELEEEIEKFNDMLDEDNTDTSEKLDNEEIIETEEEYKPNDIEKDLPEPEDTNTMDSSIIDDVKESDLKPKKNTKIIIISLIVFIILVSVIGIILIIPKDNKVTKNDTTITEEKFKTILDDYALATNKSISNYMKSNNNQVPEFKDIEKDIYFPNYNITCKEHVINYDGTLYLNDCNIEEYENKFNYTYGELKEKPVVSKNQIFIYENKINDSTYYYASNNKYEYENEYPKLINTYNCNVEDCIGYYGSSSNNHEVVIYDDEYYLFDIYTNDTNELSGVGKTKYMYIDNITDKNGDTKGLYLQKEDGNGAYYNLSKNKIVTDFIYGNNSTTTNLFSKGYYSGVTYKKNTPTLNIINQSTGDIVKSYKNVSSISDENIGGTELYFLNYNSIDDHTGCFLNTEFKKLIPTLDEYTFAVNSNNTITVKSKDSFDVYGLDGEKIVNGPKYDEVLKVVKDYVIVKDGAEIDIVDIGGKTLAKLCDDKSNYKYHLLVSDWMEDNGINGVFFIVEDTNISLGEENSVLKYYYIPESDKVGVIKTNGLA